MTKAVVVEISMCLKSTLGGAETLTGLAQVWSQLANLKMHLQVMAKTKVVCDHVWCTTCRSKWHRSDACLVLPNYMVMGAPCPFPSGQKKWCEICIQWGHVPPHSPTL
jgi:hypothetical protein